MDKHRSANVMTGSLFDVQCEAARFSFNTVCVLFVFQQGASNAEKFDYVSLVFP